MLFNNDDMTYIDKAFSRGVSIAGGCRYLPTLCWAS